MRQILSLLDPVRFCAPLASLLVLLLLSPLPCPASDVELWWEDARLQARQGHYELINHEHLAALVQQEQSPLIVDVRADYEYDRGHLPHARHMEFDLGDSFLISEEKKQRLRELLGPDPERLVIFYCRSFR